MQAALVINVVSRQSTTLMNMTNETPISQGLALAARDLLKTDVFGRIIVGCA
jgi:hypothetical protein